MKAWQNEMMKLQKDLQQQIIRQTEKQAEQDVKLEEVLRANRNVDWNGQGQNVGQGNNVQSATEPQRSRGCCFQCGQRGHFARRCPNRFVDSFNENSETTGTGHSRPGGYPVEVQQQNRHYRVKNGVPSYETQRSGSLVHSRFW